MSTFRSLIIPTLLSGMAVMMLACGDPATDVALASADQCWSVQDTLMVERSISQSSTDITVDLRFDQDFPYANLQMKLIATSPDGQAREYPFQTVVLTPQGDWELERKRRELPAEPSAQRPRTDPRARNLSFRAGP